MLFRSLAGLAGLDGLAWLVWLGWLAWLACLATQPGGDTAATRRHMLEAKTLIFHSFFNKNGSALQANLGGTGPLGP